MPDDRLDGPDQGSDDALIHHRARHPDEARGVRPEHVITGAPVPHRCRIARIVHVAHDRVQSLLALLEVPAIPRRVLAHLERRGRNAAGVRGLTLFSYTTLFRSLHSSLHDALPI